MEHDKKLVLAKAKHVVQSKEKKERQAAKEAEAGQLSTFISNLDSLLARGITIDGADNVDLLVRTTEEFGQRVSELLNEIRTRTASLDELNIPDTIELKQITDPKLLDALQNVGDNGELLSKIQTLDQTIGLLRDVIVETKAPERAKQGQTPQDYIPVRVVEDVDGKLRWFRQVQAPSFVGVSSSAGSSSSLAKATDAYSIAAISETGTYKYFFFEDADLNYYIMRKTLATNIFAYTKGTGGYTSVYVDATSGPSGSPTFASYGATF